MTVEALFRPFSYKGLHLPNRVVMAPMTRSKSPGGVPTVEVASYYARRAAAEVGFIITEGTGVARPASLNDPNIPRFHGEAELAGWKTVVDQVHAAGGFIAPQLWHVGAVQLHRVEAEPFGVARGGAEGGDGVCHLGVGHRLAELVSGAGEARGAVVGPRRRPVGAAATHRAHVP